ncbi:Gcd10p family-domain-containing protein [Myxozyma melibiosi]|uniref:tRNA (adenine(58)-N(1))-methyltransferase non-catalytic subunit TRM6 n=1 Tax=Myxozyma melibiosi TaxID=54550 RepID=A0ABR1F0T2_9ASCO
MNEDIIQPNHYVLIRLPSLTLRVVQLVPHTTINAGKFGSFYADDIIGKPFGYTYEIRDDKHVDVIYSSEGLFASSDVNADHADEEEEGEEETTSNGSTPVPESKINTNETTIDDTSIQKLSMKEIEDLKKTEHGEKIIQQVIKSHGAFEKKSIYSKEKYTRRKQQKFLRRFTPCSIGSSELIEHFQLKDYHRVLELTPESLGLMMSLANVHPGGNYIVVDDTGGLVTGAMLERMDGEGTILFIHENEHPNFEIIKYMNFPEEMTNRMLKVLNLLQLYHPEEEEPVKRLSDEILAGMKSSRRGQYYRRVAREAELTTLFDQIKNGFYDGLVLATSLETQSLLEKLIPAVAGSRQLVIYNTAKEPLVDTAHDLMADLRVLAPTILETRVRKYQVFPGRTHPLMTSRSGGGYVLWGTRVIPSNDVRAGGKKRKRLPAANKEKKAEDIKEESAGGAKRKHDESSEAVIEEKKAKIEAVAASD